MKQHQFNRLVLKLTDPLYRFALSMIGDDAVSKDLVQDTFLKLWQIRHSLNAVKNKEAYAYTILKHKCVDVLKSAAWKIRHQNDVDFQPMCSNNSEKQEELKIVQQLIQRLPDNQRMIIHLREIEGKSFEEIAEILQIEEGNVRVLLSRSRKLLRQQLEKIYDYGSTKG